MEKEDVKNYKLKGENGKTVYFGTTNDLKRREKEHEKSGKQFKTITQVGQKTTEERAAKREEEEIKTYKINHGGKRPIYNKNDSGK